MALTFEEQKRIEELERKVEELTQFMEQKKVQQLSYPIDQASLTLIQQA